MPLNEEYLFQLKKNYDRPSRCKLVLGAPEGPILVKCIPCPARLSNFWSFFVKAHILIPLNEEYLFLFKFFYDHFFWYILVVTVKTGRIETFHFV